MTSITLFGGNSEIGGNKILIGSTGTNIFLDFGSRMGYESDYFAEFLGTRTNTDLRDKLTIGVLPRIDGIYREDLIRPHGLEDLAGSPFPRVLDPDSNLFNLAVRSAEDYANEQGKLAVDGIFLSHAHLDHTGAIGYLHHQIPLYCSEVTEVLVRAIDDVTAFTSKALTSKVPEIAVNKTGMMIGAPKITKKKMLERECITMPDGTSVQVGDLSVKLIEVDHSVPGAASFVVEADGKRILYTGDIRFHGNMNMTVEQYAGKVGPIDVMLCEGTRVESEKKWTEKDIGDSIADKISKTEGIVFVDFAWKDTTRYETILEAARKNNRTFVINSRLAYLLNKLGQQLPDDVRVFLKRKGSCFYSPSDYTGYKHEVGYELDWKMMGIDLTHYENGLIASDIVADPSKYVMMLSFFDLGQIFDFTNKDGKIPGSVFIKAQCEPFSDEMEIDERRLINWLDKFGIGYEEDEEKDYRCVKRAHVSGHASRPELKELITLLAPEKLIPMHTVEPGEFKLIAEEILSENGPEIEVILPEYGIPIEL